MKWEDICQNIKLINFYPLQRKSFKPKLQLLFLFVNFCRRSLSCKLIKIEISFSLFRLKSRLLCDIFKDIQKKILKNVWMGWKMFEIKRERKFQVWLIKSSANFNKSRKYKPHKLHSINNYYATMTFNSSNLNSLSILFIIESELGKLKIIYEHNLSHNSCLTIQSNEKVHFIYIFSICENIKMLH